MDAFKGMLASEKLQTLPPTRTISSWHFQFFISSRLSEG